MDATKTEHPHIIRNERILHGQPIVKGSRISVAAVARLFAAGIDVSEIAATFDHLSLASIHDAISYYLDHQSEIDRIISESTPEAMAAHGFIVGSDGRVTLPGG